MFIEAFERRAGLGYAICMVYLTVILIWRFGKSHKYHQIKCTPFKL